MSEYVTCRNCNKQKNVDDFYGVRGQPVNFCLECREKIYNNRVKNYCPHNRKRSECVPCDGAGICQHKRRRTQCKEKECNGVYICIHGKRRSTCKECWDEIKVTINRMITGSKNRDIKKDRYDSVNFITYSFVKNLILECQDKCYYCNCDMVYIGTGMNLATIERLDNSIGNIKSNCVIACKKCNISRVGQRKSK